MMAWRTGPRLLSFLSGALFWLPSVLVHATRGFSFGAQRLDLLGVTVLPIAVSATTVFLLARHFAPRVRDTTVLAFHVLGVWVFGPTCMMVGASFSGGGFAHADALAPLGIAMLLFPPSSFIMATYDGSLGALGFVTVVLPLVLILRLLRPKPPQPSSRGHENA